MNAIVKRNWLPTFKLFSSGGGFGDHLEARKDALARHIDHLDRNYILNVSENDLVDHLVEEYSVEVPELHVPGMFILTSSETEINVSNSPGYIPDGRGYYRKATSITFVVPYTGDGNIFQYHPSNTWLNNSGYGQVMVEGQLHLEYTVVGDDAGAVARERDADLQRVDSILKLIKSEADQYVAGLRQVVESLVRGRKDRLLKAAGMVAAFNIPVLGGTDAPRTYAPPVREKMKVVRRPEASSQPYEPEPALADEIYEKIILLSHNMAVVMERNPSSFATLDEPAIRDHFMVHLNSQFGGEATGETFNHQGKTDILFRHEGANIFVAECKFWKGEKYVLDGMDQLLGNVSYRDTKTALYVFNRGQDHTKVLEKVAEAIPKHPCHKKLVERRGDPEFRYLFHRPGDSNREVRLAVLVFDVPSPAVPANLVDTLSQES